MSEDKLTQVKAFQRRSSRRTTLEYNDKKEAEELQKSKEKTIKNVLEKLPENRTEEENALLRENSDLKIKFEKAAIRNRERKEQFEEKIDDDVTMMESVSDLVRRITNAQHAVVYTGAGISTSANIPDYRSPTGVWTQLAKGKVLTDKIEMNKAIPTITHMCLRELFDKGLIKHVVSQNCDGLHLRSGLSQSNVSELHGNCYIEICKFCVPQKEYVRGFDVTEKTAFRRHSTGRLCDVCHNELFDTIVHFGESGVAHNVLGWDRAIAHAKKADLIICMGSSLKVLKKYPKLWPKEKGKFSHDLVVINLQWTPKDKDSILKIHGRCDDIMLRVFKELNLSVPPYDKEKDVIPIQLEGLSAKRDAVQAGWYGKGLKMTKRKK